MFTLRHQAKNLAEPREVDPLPWFQRMLFKEGNDPFAKVIQPSDSIGHPVTVVRSNDSTAEEFLQRVKQLNVPPVLDNREFGEHLKLAGHFWMRVDVDAKATFAVNKPHNPLSI
jgi:hypothetical protein